MHDIGLDAICMSSWAFGIDAISMKETGQLLPHFEPVKAKFSTDVILGYQ